MKSADICPILPSDAGAIAAMIGRLARHIRPDFTSLATEADILRFGPAGLKLFEAVIARVDGEAVGFCLYTFVFSGWQGKPGLCVNDLYVDESQRGTGLGRALLADVVRRERQKGCAFVRLDVDQRNDTAYAFYRRLGFIHDDHDHLLFLETDGFGALGQAG